MLAPMVMTSFSLHVSPWSIRTRTTTRIFTTLGWKAALKIKIGFPWRRAQAKKSAAARPLQHCHSQPRLVRHSREAKPPYLSLNQGQKRRRNQKQRQSQRGKRRSAKGGSPIVVTQSPPPVATI